MYGIEQVLKMPGIFEISKHETPTCTQNTKNLTYPPKILTAYQKKKQNNTHTEVNSYVWSNGPFSPLSNFTSDYLWVII